jgi:DDE superfamily endonuclease/Transposase
MVMTSTVEHFLTPRQMKRKLELDVSSHTIDRRLQEANLFGRVAQHKHTLTAEEKRKRLSFAEGYKHWTKEDWERVLFSDEKIFYGAGFCGREWVRRPPGQALNPEYTVDKKPHPVKVHVWACFSARGLGYCHIFNEHLDGKLLKRILSDNLIPSARLHFTSDPPEQWYFLQDNDPKHCSHLVRNWLHNNGVTCIDFPPYSPDLNPSENLWNDLARRVEKHQAEEVELLQDTVAEEWKKTAKKLLTQLAHSMPKRCELVIAAKGGYIDY